MLGTLGAMAQRNHAESKGELYQKCAEEAAHFGLPPRHPRTNLPDFFGSLR